MNPFYIGRSTLSIDLDGTLIKTDLLMETASCFLIEQSFRFFKLLVWLAEGKSALKSRLAESTSIDVTSLPYTQELLTWLRADKAQGRRTVLATASHRILADQVAAHLDLFDEVLATDGATILKASAKRDALVSRYGERGYDYVGNDWPDIKVWQSADKAHVVSSSSSLIKKVRNHGDTQLLWGDARC